MQEYSQLQGNSLSNLYADGCIVSYLSTTTAMISAGQVRDSTNSCDILVESPLFLDMKYVGVNGLDTGTFAGGKTYYVYVIYDATQQNIIPQCVASLSTTQPVMPSANGSTFSNFRMVGVLFSDLTPNIRIFTSFGSSRQRLIQFDQYFPQVLISGSSITYQHVNLSSHVPAVNFGKVQLFSAFIPGNNGSSFGIKAFGQTPALYTQVGGIGLSIYMTQIEIVPGLNAGIPTIDYVVTFPQDNLYLAVTGFEFNI